MLDQWRDAWMDRCWMNGEDRCWMNGEMHGWIDVG